MNNKFLKLADYVAASVEQEIYKSAFLPLNAIIEEIIGRLAHEALAPYFGPYLDKIRKKLNELGDKVRSMSHDELYNTLSVLVPLPLRLLLRSSLKK